MPDQTDGSEHFSPDDEEAEAMSPFGVERYLAIRDMGFTITGDVIINCKNLWQQLTDWWGEEDGERPQKERNGDDSCNKGNHRERSLGNDNRGNNGHAGHWKKTEKQQ